MRKTKKRGMEKKICSEHWDLNKDEIKGTKDRGGRKGQRDIREPRGGSDREVVRM